MKSRNIPLFKVFSPTKEILAALEPVLESGMLTQGPRVDEFEEILKKKFLNENLVTVNTGTSAIHLALHLCGVRAGDSVVVSPLTCFATVAPVLAMQANVVWADTDPETFNIDLDDIVYKSNENTKALLFVHWGGAPVDTKLLKEKFELAGKKLPTIIEDCAHSQGALRYNYPVASLEASPPSYCEFSLQAIKHINTFDGGILTLPTKSEYDRAKLVRWYGIDREEKGRKDFRAEIDIKEWGYKFHMNDLNAAVGIVQMRYFDKVVSAHKDNASYYNKALKNFSDVKLQKIPSCVESSYWLYTMKVENREGFMKHMRDCGVVTSRVHQRTDIHTCVSMFKTELPKLDSFNENIVNIPVGWWVSEDDREYIVDCIKRGW